jgi:hypothetical protein
LPKNDYTNFPNFRNFLQLQTLLGFGAMLHAVEMQSVSKLMQ